MLETQTPTFFDKVYRACANSDLDQVKRLMTRRLQLKHSQLMRAFIHAKYGLLHYSSDVLHFACTGEPRNKNMEIIEYLVNECQMEIKENLIDCSHLQEACISNRPSCIKRLLALHHYVNIDHSNMKLPTALELAINWTIPNPNRRATKRERNKARTCAYLLLDCGASLDNVKCKVPKWARDFVQDREHARTCALLAMGMGRVAQKPLFMSLNNDERCLIAKCIWAQRGI